MNQHTLLNDIFLFILDFFYLIFFNHSTAVNIMLISILNFLVFYITERLPAEPVV